MAWAPNPHELQRACRTCCSGRFRHVQPIEMRVDDGDIEEEVAFLKGLTRTCRWIGLAHFLVTPLVFTMAKLDFAQLTFAFILFQVFVSLAAQVRVREGLCSWLQDQAEDWQEHLDAMRPEPGMALLPVHELCIYMGSLTEALDPALDAWTAANSETMCASRCLASFETSWNMPVLGPAIGRLGLPGVLLLVLCISAVGQFLEFLRQECKVHEKLELLKDAFPYEDVEEAVKHRWQVWIYMSHMTDVGGAMLLHDLFLALVRVEISLSNQIWPVPGREASFRFKIALEALPSLWLQITLLTLTWESASNYHLAVTLVSVACAVRAISAKSDTKSFEHTLELAEQKGQRKRRNRHYDCCLDWSKAGGHLQVPQFWAR
ncbi:Hypothetical protein SCF082_LOCUS40094 [Durusdinium trenchii]|uniref:Uncharacterized protein n=1 Tax=Durusdinium trenchii TaxID=1381693 RepID=A0ABP0Q8G0_9DINO